MRQLISIIALGACLTLPAASLDAQSARGLSIPGYFGPLNGREGGGATIAPVTRVGSAAQCAALCDARGDCRSFDYGTGGQYAGNCYLVGGWPPFWDAMRSNPDVAHYDRLPVVHSPVPTVPGSGFATEDAYQRALQAGGNCAQLRDETYGIQSWYWNSFAESGQYAEVVDPSLLERAEPVMYPRPNPSPTELDLAVDRFIRLVVGFPHCFPGLGR